MDMQVFKIVPSLAKQSGDFLVRNSPSVLTAISVGGLFTTVFMAIRATPRAMDIIFSEECKREADALKTGFEELPISKIDIIKLTWKIYVPTVIMTVATTFCIIGSNTINLRRNAALASLYGIADTALQEYKEKVRQTLGERREAKLQEEISQDKLNAHPVQENQIIITGHGESLMYDELTDRYFMFNIEDLNKAINRFNHRIINGDSMLTLNEFYDLINLPHCKLGDDLGWSADENLVEVVYTAKIAKSSNPMVDDRPCIVIKYRFRPHKV